MLDALIDTLMALWNAPGREKALPTLFAFLAVGISTCIFLMQVGLPTLSRLSPPSSPGSLQGQAGRSNSLAIKSHVTASVQVIAVSTPVQTGGDTKNSPTPIPTPAQATTYPPAPAPMPVQLPGIVSLPDIYSPVYTGATDIVSTDTIPAKSEIHEPIRHSSPRKTATSVPTVDATTVAPTATATGGTITPMPTQAPTTVAPTLPPTPIAVATPTVVVPTNAPTPTNPVPVYPATPTSASTPAKTVTVSPAIVPTDTGRATVSPTAKH